MKNAFFPLFALLIGTQTLWGAAEMSHATARRIRIATEVVDNRMQSTLPIPKWVLDKSKCMASLKVVKVGLIWGGEGSTGLVSCRTTNNSWSAPSFLNVGGVTFGLQIGIQFLESVVLFMNDHSVEMLNHPTVQIGTDLSYAAGPYGQGSGMGVLPNASVLTYDQAVGLYAGATINGFILSHGLERNWEVYGSNVTPKEILHLEGKTGPKAIQPFVEVLEKYAPF